MQGVPLLNAKMILSKICLVFLLYTTGWEHFSHYSSLVLDPLQQSNSTGFSSSSYHLLSSLPQKEPPHFNQLHSLYDYPKPLLQNDTVKTPKHVYFYHFTHS